MPDICLNLLIFTVTLILVVCLGRKDGAWLPARWKAAFRFFTCLSNMFCAAACLLTAASSLAGEIPEWIWLLKYAGTAAVTVTMLTVFLFLAPSIGKGWVEKLLTGTAADLFMHLLTPSAALLSFCVLEKRGLSFGKALLGMLPVLLYGILYFYKIKFAPAEKRWKDFYGFDRDGKWILSAVGMLLGTFLVCMVLLALQNL